MAAWLHRSKRLVALLLCVVLCLSASGVPSSVKAFADDAAVADPSAEATVPAAAPVCVDLVVPPGESVVPLMLRDGAVVSSSDSGTSLFSQNSSIASVDSAGHIVGVKTGTTSITVATQDGARCSFNVRVGFADVTSADWYYEIVNALADVGLMTGYGSTLAFGPNDSLSRGQAAVVLYRIAGETLKPGELEANQTTAGKTAADSTASNASAAQNRKTFSDVKPTDYYYDAVTWAQACGIVTGYAGTDRFGPTNPVSREQLCVMIHRMAVKLGAAPDTSVAVEALSSGSESAEHAMSEYVSGEVIMEDPAADDAAAVKEPDAPQVDPVLGVYEDMSIISAYAVDAVRWCVENSLMGGSSKLMPAKTATRAEAGKMLLTAYRDVLLAKRFVSAYRRPASGSGSTSTSSASSSDGSSSDAAAPTISWSVSPYIGTVEMTSAAFANTKLDVTGSSTASGSALQFWSGNNSIAQRFTTSNAGNGTIRITAVVSKLALTAKDGGVVQEAWSGAATQRWVPVKTTAGTMLVNAGNGLALTAVETDGSTPALALLPATWDKSQAFTWNAVSPYTPADIRTIMSAAKTSRTTEGFGGYIPSTTARNALNTAINNIRKLGYDIGFLMVDMTTGKGVSYNADTYFYSASTIKGPYVASVASMYPASLSQRRTTMQQTIGISSNDGYIALRRTYGTAPMVKWCQDAGVPTSLAALNYPQYTARQLAKLWTRNYEFFTYGNKGSDVSAWYAAPWNSTIHSVLGSRYATRTKPGWIADGVLRATNDAGIVYASGKPYVVVILTNLPVNFAPLRAVITAADTLHREML